MLEKHDRGKPEGLLLRDLKQVSGKARKMGRRMTKGHWWMRAKVAGTFIGIVVLAIFLAPASGMASPVSLTWTTRAAMPTARESFGIATDGSGAIYAFGGRNATGTLGTVERYDPSTDDWSPRTPMPVPLNGSLAVRGGDGIIYVIGGNSRVYDSSTFVQAYDPISDTWSFKSSYPVRTVGAAGALGSDDKIYVFGGYPGCCGSYLSSSFSYDPASDTWTPIAPMPTPREAAAAALAANGRIYVAGGNGSGPVEQTMEAYDPATNTWETDAPMPIGMTNMSLVAAPNGDLYAFGEPEPFTGSAGTVLQYTPATNSWAALAPLPSGRAGARAILAGNGNIYAIGGVLVDSGGSVTQYVGTNEEGSFVPPCPGGTKANFRWHYSANGSAGRWSDTATQACPGSFSMGPQAMEGHLLVAPGATLKAGYDFTLPGNHNSLTMMVSAAYVTFAVSCVSGATPSASTFTVTMQAPAYQVTNDQWYPSGDQSSPLVYQGTGTVPDLCGGGALDLAKSGTFSATLG